MRIWVKEQNILYFNKHISVDILTIPFCVKLGVNLDIGHYNALLRVYLENEYDFAPSDILVDLEKKGLEPNRVTYSRLIMKYCQKGDIDGATSILEYMRKKDIPINVNIFNALIFGHTQRK